MDIDTLIKIVISIAVVLAAGLTIKLIRRKTSVKARDNTKVATETNGDVIQTKEGAVQKIVHNYFGPVVIRSNADPSTPIPSPEQQKIKKTYLEIAQKLKAPEAVIDHSGHVAETSSGSFGTLSKAIPYVSGIIAQSTGNEEDEVAQQIIKEAHLENYLQIVGSWECSHCHKTNFADARFCCYCGKQRDSEINEGTL
jgi:hypothetical protein